MRLHALQGTMDKHILALAKLRALAPGASFATFGEAPVFVAAASGEAAKSPPGSEFTRHPCMQKGMAIRFVKLDFATCASMFQVEEKYPLRQTWDYLGELNLEIVACRARGVLIYM